jgi:hypothetical protein
LTRRRLDALCSTICVHGSNQRHAYVTTASGEQ